MESQVYAPSCVHRSSNTSCCCPRCSRCSMTLTVPAVSSQSLEVYSKTSQSGSQGLPQPVTEEACSLGSFIVVVLQRPKPFHPCDVAPYVCPPKATLRKTAGRGRERGRERERVYLYDISPPLDLRVSLQPRKVRGGPSLSGGGGGLFVE